MEVKKLKNSKTIRVNRLYDIVSLVVGCIVCLFHILGVSVPGWWIVEEADPRGSHLKFYFGVWSTKTCQNDICITEVAKMSQERAWLIGPAVLTLLAGALQVSVVVLIAFSVLKSWDAAIRKLCVLLSGGSGGVVILSVLIFVKKKMGLLPSTAPETSDGNPGWTLVISTVGSILALINAIIIVIGVSRNFKSERPPTSHLNMEIQVNGKGSGLPASGNLGSNWQIQKQQQVPRRGSGMVYYVPDFREYNETL